MIIKTPVCAIIPVFNRIQYTLTCIICLKSQIHPLEEIIVVDGGSTDGTPDILRDRHPDVTVLAPGTNLYWGEASAVGIQHVLKKYKNGKILLVNNDTAFSDDLVGRLIKTSYAAGNAGVTPVIIDSDDPGTIIDSGVNIDWSRYHFKAIMPEQAHSRDYADVDMLPARATLIPIEAIQEGGSIDAARWPHYLSDFEFTYRLKTRAKLRLVVDYGTAVATRIDEPQKGKFWLGYWHRMFSWRSKSNVVDHIRFIKCHAPQNFRNRLILRIILHSVFNLNYFLNYFFRRKNFLKQKIIRLFSPYYVREIDIANANLSTESLLINGIIEKKSLSPVFYNFSSSKKEIELSMPSAIPLYRKSTSFKHKVLVKYWIQKNS